MASEDEQSSATSTNATTPTRWTLPLNMMNDIPAVMYQWQVDPKTGESTFLYVSDYCWELMGVSPQEAMNDASSIVNLIHDDDVSMFSAALIQSMHDLTVLRTQVRMRRRTGGQVVPVQFQGRPQRHEGGVIVWDGVAMEVATTVPQQPPQQALAVVQEAQLQSDAAIQLVQAERGLTEWLHHEIKNPLSVTMEALQTLQELFPHEEQHQVGAAKHDDDNADDGYSAAECHQVMTESITYVVDLLNNMMDLDQCAQGQMPVVNTPCNVQNDILLPTYRMMRRLRPKNPVKLRLSPSLRILGETALHHASMSFLDLEDASEHESECSTMHSSASSAGLDDTIVANVDKLRLRQILTNLIANAFHFTSQGFVEVDLQVQDSVFAFHVRDSGCGVDSGDIDTLFTRWEQLGTSRNGTGIGLCLCQALLKAMGGNIRLNADYHSGIAGHPGAEFIVEVPIHTASVASPTTPAAQQKRASSTMQRTPPSSSLTSAILASSQSTLEMDETQRSKVKPTLATTGPPPSTQTASPEYNLFVGVSNMSVAKSPVRKSPIQKKSYYRGQYRFLIVDDEKMGRKFLKRRFSRLFPGATVTEVASGEEALVEASKHQYDVITMDHFMAINEMNGDETIRKLRCRLHSDALIMGISGNDKQVEHLHAGADLFFLKPLPSDTTLIESLQNKLAPPAGWKVLILSPDASVSSLLTEQLHRVASPHFTTKEVSEKRWTIVSRSSYLVDDAEDFDMVVVVESGNSDDALSSEARKQLRGVEQCDKLVVVECLTSDEKKRDSKIVCDTRGDTKPAGPVWYLSNLPSVEGMRQSLSQSLLAIRSTPDRTKNSSESGLPVLATGLPPKRQNSGVAKSA
ncbi:respiration control sensor protein ArcB [Seminavis robusta]|uniref:histidine kinase n=1 Tax=Seminavis robusta TaxID=568900 RepID=A0A9N8EJE2_9STRA|nr:respiration control sensor protein ArcB [Seminavis robusta]|eukprot:Sro1339_g264280.1 respiration control sensor protein ArcB (858) ;mRNA; f:7584-10492